MMPRPARASTTGADAPRAAKDCDIGGSLLAAPCAPRDDSGDSTDPDRRSAREKNLADEARPLPYDASSMPLVATTALHTGSIASARKSVQIGAYGRTLRHMRAFVG